MIIIATCILILALLVLIVRWIAAVPLVRAITASIDGWADGVHGLEREALR
jgi:hypothetical protein